MLHTWSKSPASVLHSKCRSTEGWLSHFFEIASTGIAEVTWRRAPIHTKIGRFSCCDFYSCNCPSLGIATDLNRNILPLATGMWDSSGEKRHKEQEEAAAPHQSTGAAPEWDGSANAPSPALAINGEPPGNSGNADWAWELPPRLLHADKQFYPS